MQTGASEHFDVVIGGGGPTGLTMALALATTFEGDVRVAVVDPASGQAPNAEPQDPRAWALSSASVRLLENLGVWSAVAPNVQPVSRIEITDSALEAGVRPVLLSYDNVVNDGEPAAYIVPNQALLNALAAAVQARAASIACFSGRSIETFAGGTGAIQVSLDNSGELTADLLVAADGRASKLRQHAGIDVVQWSYDQLGIVTTVGHDRPHQGKAVQHFLPGGPFAMLPLPDDRTCITWSEATEVARDIMAMDDDAFLAEVQQRFGGKLGFVKLAGPRASFPLGMHLARSYTAPRLALIGDAAHGVHPIAGQGLNLAFRDIAALSECIAGGVRTGLSFGDVTLLERYQAWRRFDSTLSAGTFDAMNRLFSNDITLLRSAREVGLGLVDRVPELKRLFVNEAAGLSGDVPQLMQRSAPHQP